MNDKFAAIKSQLDDIDKRDTERYDRLFERVTILRNSCMAIAKIQPDDHGNGLRLAISIAGQAVRDSEED